MSPTAKNLHAELRKLADTDIARHARRFFKTGQGEYGEGDRFLGIRVPQLRGLARKYRATPITQILCVLKSPWHEERLLALLMLVDRYTRGDERERAPEGVEREGGAVGHRAVATQRGLRRGSPVKRAGPRACPRCTRSRRPAVTRRS